MIATMWNISVTITSSCKYTDKPYFYKIKTLSYR